MKQSKRNNKGFTITELLVAVAVIIIMAGLALPRLATAKREMDVMTLNAYAREVGLTAQKCLMVRVNDRTIDSVDAAAPKAEETGTYRWIEYNKTDSSKNKASKLLFEAGSFDSEVDGSYLIKYKSSDSEIAEVFYSSANSIDRSKLTDYRSSAEARNADKVGYYNGK